MAPLDTALEHTRRSLNLGCIFSIRLVCLGPFLWKLFLLCHSGLQLICMLLFLSMLWHRPLPSTQYSFLFVLGVDLHWSVSGLYSSARSVLLSSPSDFFLKLHLFYFKTTFGSFSQCVFLLRYSWSLISTQSSLSSLTIFIVRYKSSESRIPKTVSPGCHFLICIFPTFVVEKWAKKPNSLPTVVIIYLCAGLRGWLLHFVPVCSGLAPRPLGFCLVILVIG